MPAIRGNDYAVGNPGGGAPVDNDNAETHGLTGDPEKYYNRQSEAEQERIDGWARDWMRECGVDGLGFGDQFREQAIKFHQIRRADGYISENGLIVDGEENSAFRRQSRAFKELTDFLKDFGFFTD
jgi:hypothetical protein